MSRSALITGFTGHDGSSPTPQLCQVSAGCDAAFGRAVALDLDYIDRWSLWLDLKILLGTVPALPSGA